MSYLENILETIGGTPLVRLGKLAPAGINVFAKLEYFNPMGSVKDRMALAMIEHAEQSGALKPGQTVIEATSGNTGIGLAVVCASRGYPLVVTMPESASVERRKIMRFLGARVVLTPAEEKGTGMLNKAAELAAAHGYFLPRQFDNPVNADVHSRTTAVELLHDMGDSSIDYFVSGFGTGGTLLGVARRLKSEGPETRVIVAEPDNAQLLGSGVAQARQADGSLLGSHPNFRPHLMQGWSPDFISRLAQQALDEHLIDATLPVSGQAAIDTCLALARQEGIFAGMTGGATVAAALAVARTAEPGSNIIAMVPDTAERYMSTPLFDTIGADMNDEEIALSESTPGYRFGASVKPASVATPQSRIGNVDGDMNALVNSWIEAEPVVMFALEWCEFSWSVRKLFRQMNVHFHSIDLDSAKFQEDDLGGKVRAALHQRLDTSTIPQVFIGGNHIGGATDVLKMAERGDLQARLDECGVSFRELNDIDPQSYLPRWVQPRRRSA